jgi:parvulin-like peptidyl-prolyl cis-trans isomerase-like protein/SurA-like protein
MLRSQYGASFEGDLLRIASLNVLDELIRRELLAIEVERQKVQVSQAQVDSVLMQDPFFLTNGKFDPAKFSSFKTSPGTNYLQVLPRIREAAAMRKLDASLRARFTPTPAQIRAEWAKRNDQVRFKLLPLLNREMSTEPEATEAEWAQYYRDHSDQFTRRTRARLRYARLPIPAEGDSTRSAEESKALERAKAIADSLRRGALADTAAELTDSGLFDIPVRIIPGLGRVPALVDALAKVEEDSTLRVVGPIASGDAVIVGVIAERQPKHVPPMREVLGDVKRRADAEKRRLATEGERKAFYEGHRERWRGPRVSLTRVTLKASAIDVKPPPAADIERWYAQHGHSLFGVADSSGAWKPPLSDSLRAVVQARVMDEQRRQQAATTLGTIAKALRGGREARAAAKANGAVAETLTFSKGSGPDTLFDGPFVDSLLASARAAKGALQGPRAFGAMPGTGGPLSATTWAVWRVDAADTAFVPPYEAVRVMSDQEYAEDRRQKEETEAQGFFEQHRSDFKAPEKFGLDYVSVRTAPPDSVRVPEAQIRRRYDANPKLYRQEEEIKARHILFTTRPGMADDEKKAKARADSLLAAIRKDGGDFAELAKRFSQEPGASTSGGDLGWFGRGRMVKDFEQAAFALKPGEISAVVKTQFGFHIIKLEERKAAGQKPFETVRGEIRMQIAQARGDSAAKRAANALRRRLAQGGNPRTLAAAYGGVVSAEPIAAGAPIPDLGVVAGLDQDLRGMTLRTWAPTVYRVGTIYLVMRLREKIPPRPAEFDEVTFQAVEKMKAAKRQVVLDQKVEAIRTALAAGAPIDSLAAPYGGMRDSGLLHRTAGFVPMLGNEPRVLEKAFALRPGEATDTLNVAAGVVWIRVDEKKSADASTFKTASVSLEGELAKRRYDEWVEAKRKTVKIDILRPDLKGPRPSPFATTSPGR